MVRFRRQPFLGFLILTLLLLSASARAATPDDIDASIKKAKAFLIAQQKPTGQWEIDAARVGDTHLWQTMQGDTFGGYSSLSTYALLASGSQWNDPAIVSAVNFLKKADVIGVYALGLRLQVWLLMWQQTKDPQYKDLANADATKLMTYLAGNTGDNAGLWDYAGIGPRTDHSVSQYGVLGLWAAAQMGAEIPDKTWKLLDKTWIAGQFPEGGWGYGGTPAHPVVSDTGKASMTAAGIATLFITQEYTRGSESLNCNGNIRSDHIDDGLAWMAKNFAQADNPYTYYGIERIGVASGYKYFGTVDWFAQLADKLIGSQAADGSLGAGLGLYAGETPLTATAFSVLFLARGGAPIMLNKLDYSLNNGRGQRDANWNERPRDAFNLARWTGVQAEADNLNWHVVNLAVSVEDLHDAPILYMSGNKKLDLPAPDVDKLRQYVREGGMIIGNADCDSDVFSKSFQQLGEKMFDKYEFRQLGKTHLIYTGETYRKLREYQPIYGLSNGVREMMLLFSGGDPARSWQQNSTLTRAESFEVGADVFLYATDIKDLRKKGASYLVRTDLSPRQQTVAVARLMVGDNPDPEPGGWDRLVAILHNSPFGVDVTVTPVKSGEVLAGKYQVVHLTGTTAFKFKPEERLILQQFIDKGGTLIIDAAGGSGVFDASARAELMALFPSRAAKGLAAALPPESPIYNLPDAAIATVEYRRFARRNMMGSAKAPHIRGIEYDGRLAIFYSPEDLSAGLVGENVDGINGYTPASATALMRNLILFAAQQHK